MGEAASLRLEGALNLSVLRKKSPYSFLAWLDKCGLYFFYLEFLVSCDCQITKLQTFDTVLHFFPYNAQMPDLRLPQLSLCFPVSPGNQSLC